MATSVNVSSSTPSTKLWNVNAGGCLGGSLDDEKKSGAFSVQLGAACARAKTEMEFGESSFKTENEVSVVGLHTGVTANLNARNVGIDGKGYAEVTKLKAEAVANAEVSSTGASGKVGAEATWTSGKAGGSVGVYPSRWVGGLCRVMDGQHSLFPGVSAVCNEVSQHDFGIVANGHVGGIVGFAASAEAHLKGANGHVDAGGAVKLAPGLGPDVGVSFQVGWFDKNK